MFKQVLSLFIIATSLFWGENAMAENALNRKQQSIAKAGRFCW